MKIFYVGMEYDHYDPRRGKSFEYTNFYLSLAALPNAEVVNFSFDKILTVGRKAFNKELLEEVKKQKPDIVFVFMYSDELDPTTLKELKKYTTTIAWFADDSWRFYNYSKFWAKHFTWAITTYSWMPELYRKAGQPNVIRSQWAMNSTIYKPTKAEHGAQVSFVGGKTPSRETIIKNLHENGIDIEAFGTGWSKGRISEEKMIEVFSNSKINLALNPPPGRWTRNAIGRLLLRPSLNTVALDLHLISNFKTFAHQNIRQIKARHFEIPACGGSVLTVAADDIENYYVPDKEIVLYKDDNELLEKIHYYLQHEEERARIAKAAYERTVRDHTYEKRFAEIFKTVGLK
jgi:spore maturation protein CgeB